jgi:hypothetical protein
MVQNVVNVGSKAHAVLGELFYLYVVSSLFKYTSNQILLYSVHKILPHIPL